MFLNIKNNNILTPNDSILYANGSVTYNQKQIEEAPYGTDNNDGKKVGAPRIQDFRKILRENQNLPTLNKEQGEKNGALAEAPNYFTENYESRVNIGGTKNRGPGNSEGKNLLLYTNNSGIGPIDKINALPIYRSKNKSATNNPVSEFSDTNNPKAPIKDLIAFRIAAIDSGQPQILNYMHFRAFIDSFSDSYTGEWGSIKYSGRGESFYNYTGYDRNISLGFTIAAQSMEEMKPMYQKLNYLASNLTPDYSKFGYMRGPLVKLTIGNYLEEQVGFIKSLTYTIPNESPWDIDKEMPFIINVSSFNFVPIQATRPSKIDLSFNGGALVGAQNPTQYISYATYS